MPNWKLCANDVKIFLFPILAITLALGNVSNPAYAQGGNRLPIVRDAETENLLRDYAQPILEAAGLRVDSVRPVLINNKGFNAFVADSSRIFINVGVLIDAETPGEVIGVLAHETGHIAGHHLVRLRRAASNAQLMAVVGVLLGVGALAAGVASDSGETAKTGVAVLGGGANVAQRSLLAYKRSEETSADRAAVTYLNRTKQSAKGLLKTFQRLASSALFSERYSDPYAISHPIPRERISQLESVAMKSKYFDVPDPPELQRRHDLVRAKLIAYTSDPATVQGWYPDSDNSLPAQYARAVTAMRSSNIKNALAKIDSLIEREPNNQYFWELKGQALLESGRAKESVVPYKKAFSLSPKDGQLQIMYGYSLVASENPKNLNLAVKNLQQGISKDPNSHIAYRQLAIAKSRLGLNAEADLATAQGLMIGENYDQARAYAKRAQSKFEEGSREWILADDIISYEPPELRN